MTDEINYKNNPLNGVGLKDLLSELVSHYGFDILFAYLNINCFKTNPSLESSVKFLKKTEWARIKVEQFYMYKYKNLPRASYDQFEIPPRDRIVPDDQTPREPAVLSLEDAEKSREKRARDYALSGNKFGAQRDNKHTKKRDVKNPDKENRKASNSLKETKSDVPDPWAKWR